ncbi:Membrane protein involved in the export of O-antigen and teichoic acid [Eubacterium ruminantium]|nr:Membrane protein involved in the export of O-antigen and teichoic acid [Eubacterium ruminantium]
MSEKLSKNALNRKAFVAGFFFVLVQILVRGISFLTTPIYTRLVSTAQYGEIRIYESWLLIAVPVMSLCLYRSVLKAYFEFEGHFDDFVSSVHFLASLSTLVMFGCITVFCRKWFMDFTGMNTIMFIYMLLFVLGCTGLYFFQNKELQLLRYQKSTLVTSITMLSATALSILLLYIGNKTDHKNELVVLRIIGFYTPQIIGGIVVITIMWRAGKKLVNKTYWIYALKYSVPLIPEVLSIQIMNQADKIMIQKMVNDHFAGIFALGTTISFIIWILEDAVWNAWRPWLFEKIDRDEIGDIEKPWLNVALIFSFLSWGLVAVAPEAIHILGGKKYRAAIYLVAPMVTGTLFRFFSYGFSAVLSFQNKTQYVAAGTVGVMFVNVGLNWVFIKNFGYQAAAYTTAASYLLLLVVQGILERKVTGKTIVSIPKMVLISLVTFGINVASMLLYDLKWYFRYAVIVLITGAAFVILMPMIKQLLKQMKKKPKKEEN